MNQRFISTTIEGSALSNSDVENALRVYEDAASRAEGDPVRIVIYGYSAGGEAALEFARQLDAQGYPVDLMVLVDPANGPRSTSINREVAGNVRKVVTYYQTRVSGVGSVGAPSSRGTNVDVSLETFNGSPFSHATIDEAVFGRVVSTILEHLGYANVGHPAQAPYVPGRTERLRESASSSSDSSK